MRVRILVIAVAVAAGFIACGGSDGPSSPVVPTVFGPPKTLQISGNLNLTAAGQSSQLTATATFANGQSRNVSTQVKWEVTNPAVATISASGLLRAVSLGEAQVTATFRNVTSPASAVTVKTPATVARLTVTGPTQMTPGSIEQFTATEQLSDGSTRDVSATAVWSSSTSLLLRHQGSGRFQAAGAGEARAYANIDRQFAQSPAVLIQPSGTFKLTGTVRDVAGELDGVTVEVAAGTGAPQKNVTNGDGRYALYGVAGAIRLRVSSAGYEAQESGLEVSGPAVHDFTLATTKSIVDVSGTWTLKVSATSACTSGWPEALRQREVTAAIAQRDTRLTVTFSGPTVRGGLPSTGKIAGDVFSLWIYGDSYYYREYSLLDHPTQTDWVGVYGGISATATSSTVTGTFDGWFDYYVTPATATFFSGVPRNCRADPVFELRR